MRLSRSCLLGLKERKYSHIRQVFPRQDYLVSDGFPVWDGHDSVTNDPKLCI